MLNQVIVVGRIVEMPKDSILKISVSRPYKNENGVYESDIVEIVLWEGVITQITDYSHVGDIIGVRGRLEGNKIICEKVTFLSSNK